MRLALTISRMNHFLVGEEDVAREDVGVSIHDTFLESLLPIICSLKFHIFVTYTLWKNQFSWKRIIHMSTM